MQDRDHRLLVQPARSSQVELDHEVDVLTARFSPLHLHAGAAQLTGPAFFPQLISGPFRNGLHEAFLFAIMACLVAAAASALRGSVARPEPARERARDAVRGGTPAR